TYKTSNSVTDVSSININSTVPAATASIFVASGIVLRISMCRHLVGTNLPRTLVMCKLAPEPMSHSDLVITLAAVNAKSGLRHLFSFIVGLLLSTLERLVPWLLAVEALPIDATLVSEVLPLRSEHPRLS
ncbi:hypothetical protein L915_04622, partial [Phytophthora nicotianae]